ncbi:MAG: tRNA lysidine(34) synthetase TilS [bacterium]
MARGDRVLLAVSGGLDSVVLLDLFSKLKAPFGLWLAVVHLNHGIRGREAERDLNFVGDLSERYGLPFYHEQADAKKLARQHHYSLEESARILRYEFYQSALKKFDARRLATGHTANDQAETILDHFLRGSGISGLSGMAQIRGPFIRPLLTFSRAALESYARGNGLEYVHDSSNNDLQFKRNRIRHELMPYLLRQFNPNLVATLNRTGTIFREAEELLKREAKAMWDSVVTLHKKNEIILDIDSFLSYFIILKKYLLFHVFEQLSIDRNELNFEKLERILRIISRPRIGKRIIINQDWQLSIDHDGIVIGRRKKSFSKIAFTVSGEGTLKFQDYSFCWSIIEKCDLATFEHQSNVEYLDYERTGSELLLRNFQPADRFVPLNFTGQKKVARFFSDRKIPHHLREEIPILESQKGIVWICGYCIDNRFKVTAKTHKILKFEMQEAANAP